MTFPEIKAAMNAGGKIVQDAQIYRYLRMFKIKPLGIRQRPQQYPADSAERILKYLGISVLPAGTIIAGRHTVKILTLKQIKSQTKNKGQL